MHQSGLPLYAEIHEPWHIDTLYCTSEAAENGHLDCLKYAHENGCPWDRRTTYYSAENGHLDCLKYAHENRCPWDRRTTSWAAINDNLDCLKYAHENGCPWDKWTTMAAAENSHFGHLDCLRYLIENGCPYDTENKELVEKVKQVTIDIQTTKNLIKKSAKHQLNNNVINHIINKYI